MKPFHLLATLQRVATRALMALLGLVTLFFLAPQPAWAQVEVQSQGGWQRCAGQDEVCRFPGPALVRYGAGGRYAYKVGMHRLICDQYEFGDPAFGQQKACDYNPDVNAQPGVGGGGSGGDNWVPCGGEGDTCRFNGSARVRYGVEHRYVYRNAVNSVRCSADVFGDPAFGTPKRCEYQQHSFSGGSDAGWDYCASEGGICRFSGAGEVRYGAKGRFVTKRAINGMPCSVEAFGRDPVFGERKSCFVRQRP